MALTVAQIREHVGAMMQNGLNNSGYLAKGGLTFRELVVWSKDYRENGVLGTQAERLEAMKAFLRYAYQKVTGNDPAVNLHHFRNHWIDEIVPGEGAVVEP